MLNLKKVAITGGLSCGKTTVCRFFRELGAYVISADAIVHEQLNPLTTLGKQVIQLLGKDIVDGSQINRSKIAQKVFHDTKLLREVEKITHPIVKEEIESRYNAIKNQSEYTLFVAEVPLLYEAGWTSMFDAIIAIVADQASCQKRFMQQTGYQQEEYFRRMSTQMDPKEKAQRADYVIENNGSLEDLKEQVYQIFSRLT